MAQGTIYFQTVFLLAKKTPSLLAIGAEARSAFGWGPNYMPHLSLIYSEMDESERAKLVEEQMAKWYGDGGGSALKEENGFRVEAVQIWETDPSDLSTGSWNFVQEVSLG